MNHEETKPGNKPVRVKDEPMEPIKDERHIDGLRWSSPTQKFYNPHIGGRNLAFLQPL